MRKIAIGALILFAIAVLVQDFFKDKKANAPIAPRPYVIMLSLDGFRFDYCSKANTPTFDSIAKYGVKAEGLQPVFPTLTFPNHYSIATGLYAGNHGLIANNFLIENLDQFYNPSNQQMIENGEYYKGEPIWVTAGSNRLKTASYFWVATEAVIKGYQPDVWKPYDAKTTYPARLDSVVSWLKKPYKERPHLVTCYIELADNLGHHQGPDSREIEDAVIYIDSLIGSFTHKLNQLSIKDSINFIVVSDHGMAPTDSSKVVFLSNYLKTAWIDTFAVTNPFGMIYCKKKCVDSVKQSLTGIEGVKVWEKEELPDRFHLKQADHLGQIIVLADSSWSIKYTDDKMAIYKGAHGYDNQNLLMNGIFYAIGPSFKQGYQSPILQNIDIYNLLCRLLEIEPADNDGKMERIEEVLK